MARGNWPTTRASRPSSVVTLALGIGLTTTMFSIVYGALMRGLPFEHGERVVSIRRANPPATRRAGGEPARPGRLPRAAALVRGAGRVHQRHHVVERGREARALRRRLQCSANGFGLIRAKPLLGRTFRTGEDAVGAPALVVLGYEIGRAATAATAACSAAAVRVNGEPAEVIGVMPGASPFPPARSCGCRCASRCRPGAARGTTCSSSAG